MTPTTTDADVESLARSLRLGEACDLAEARGDRWRALELGVEARDLARVDRIARAIARATPDPSGAIADRARAIAIRRADPACEGAIAGAFGALDDAIACYERGGVWVRAAALLRSRGDLAAAGRALERHVAVDPGDTQARTVLAELLVDAGRHRAALRAIRGLAGAAIDAVRRRAHAALGLLDGRDRLDGTAEPPTTAASALLFGRYEVVREVASTPSSRVLEACDRLAADAPSARVALKIFTGAMHVGAGRDALARFHREMEILAQLDVPGVLRPRALLAEGPTIVLPWMTGGSVEDLLARGAVAPARAREIVVRVLEALEAAHRRGVLHRDVKASNVLLDEAGGAFLADFGVAHLGDASSTATAGVFGTLHYMSPEQRRGEPATRQSDLYAVGVLLAELLGVPADPARLPLLSPALLSEDLRALLAELLADEPAARPADAASVRARALRATWGESLARGAIGCPDRPLVRGRPAEEPPPRSERFTDPDAAGVRRDLVLERDEVLVDEADPRAPLVEALARIDDPVLPAVFGYDEGRHAWRVEAIDGPPAPPPANAAKLVAPLAAAGVDPARALADFRRGARGVRWRLPGR